LKKQDTLFSVAKTKATIAIQTDDDSRKPGSRGQNRPRGIDSQDNFGSSQKSLGLKNLKPDPDAYKEDWVDSIIFKKAMKAEAIKRGLHVPSEFEIDEEEERVAMTAIDAMSVNEFDKERGVGTDASIENYDNMDLENAQDADDMVQHKHTLGFMK